MSLIGPLIQHIRSLTAFIFNIGCNSNGYRRFRGSTARNQEETGGKQSSLCLIFDLKMKAKRSFETPVDFHHTTWGYISENGTLHMVHLPHIYHAFIYTMEH
jgi:hypothetical protein